MSSNNNQGEPAFHLLIMIGLFCGFVWIVWRGTHAFWLTYFFRWLRYAELWIPNLFNHRYNACLDWLRVARPDDLNPSSMVVSLTNSCFGSTFLAGLPSQESMKYYQLSLAPVEMLGAEAMSYYRWPLVGVLGGIGIYEMFFSAHNKFFTRHNLESLIKTQSIMWPAISPIVKFNPSKTGRILGDPIPDVLPVFAEALSPEEWVSWNRIPVVNGIPDRDACRRAFIRQLGPAWNGINALPIYMRALVAAFALKGAQKREESDDFLGRLALAWSPEKGFRPEAKLVDEINKIIKDPELGGHLHAVMDQHAYRTTAMLSALRWARANGGVLAPAQFLWLRAEDRALWYPMNNLGRRAYHSEGAGAMAHFMGEESAKKPLPIPRVDTAVVTLNTYLHDPDKRPVPIPPREGAKG